MADSYGATATAWVTCEVRPSSEMTPLAVEIERPAENAGPFYETVPIELGARVTNYHGPALPGEYLRWSGESVGVLGTGYLLATSALTSPGTTITLTAIDSFGRTAIATRAVSVLPVESIPAPSVEISSPLPAGPYYESMPVTLSGNARDVRDGGLGGAQLTWLSSVAGPLGTGGYSSVSTLSEGDYVITLTATKSPRARCRIHYGHVAQDD